MSMMITSTMTAANAVYNLNLSQNALSTLQEQVSSGLNVNEPGDNPLATSQLLGLQNQLDAGTQQTANITTATTTLNLASTALGGMTSLLQQVQSVAASVSSGANSASNVASATSSLSNLKSQLIDLANTQSGGQYIFGGFSGSAPFDAAGNFTGTADSTNVDVGSGLTVATNVSGGNLLLGGTPPAAVGSGTTAGSSPVNIIGSINALITAISTNSSSGISDGLANLDAATSQVATAQSDVAGRLTRLTNLQTMITSNQTTLQDAYSNLQSVNLTTAGVALSQQTTAFSAALDATSKLTQLSLLNYLT